MYIVFLGYTVLCISLIGIVRSRRSWTVPRVHVRYRCAVRRPAYELRLRTFTFSSSLFGFLILTCR